MTIRTLLEQELESCKLQMEEIGRKLLELPKGSLQKKKIGPNRYYYLAYRVKSRVITEYLGKELDKEQIKTFEKAKTVRADLRREISELRYQIRKIEKLLSNNDL